MASAIPGFTPTTPTAGISSLPVKTLSGADFLNLMIQQLAQQDPLNPTDSNQLLTQMSQISQLQSSAALETSLKGLTLQQSIGAGGNLIGKSVSGIDGDGTPVDGLVTSVKVVNKKVYLELDSGAILPMENVTQIASGDAAALTTMASSVPALQQLLQNNGSGVGTQELAALLSMLGAA